MRSYSGTYNSRISSDSFMLFDPPLGRQGLPVPGVLAAKDDLGIGCLLAAVRAGGTDGIARLLLRSFEGNGICSDSHKKTSFQLL